MEAETLEDMHAAESDIAFTLHVTGLRGTRSAPSCPPQSCGLLTTLTFGTQLQTLNSSGVKAHR
jgi:hypothetical protein